MDFSQIDQLAANVFGEAASGYAVPTYTPQSGAPFAIDGVFDANNDELRLDDAGAPVSTRTPIIDLRLANFPAGVTPAQGDRIAIRGANYYVSDLQPNAKGSLRLILRLAAG